MAKERDEFKRRVGKIQKHIDALYKLVRVEKQENILDEISGELRVLKETQDDPDVKAFEHAVGDRKGPQAVKG